MNYFESGYNGQCYVKSSSLDDLFYFDMKPCNTSNSFEIEINSAVEQMRHHYPNWLFVNDNSLVSQAIIPRLKSQEVLTPLATDYFDHEFWNFLSTEYQISNKIDLALLTIARKSGLPISWPVISGRMINANFSRELKKSLDLPYWVFLESERFHKIKLCAYDLKLLAFPDFIKLTPQLNRSYFLHPLHLDLYKNKKFPEPHNDLVERQIWRTLLSNKEINLYPEEWNPKKEFAPISSSHEKVSHFPIHSFLLKYFDHPNELHLKEQAWYGITN